jgi:predicted Zn-dependent protease
MLRCVGKLILARPRTVLAGVALLLLFAGAAGGYAYALGEWRAAERAVKEGRPAEARERLALCLKVWPRSAAVRLLAARAARLRGDMTEAEAHLNACKRLQGGEASEAVQLEFLLMRAMTGEVDDPKVNGPLFGLVEAGHPDAAAILDTVALAFMRDLNYGKAVACLNLWIEREPGNARPYHLRGWVLERMNNHKASLADYHKALQLDPDLFPVRLRIAEVLLEDKLPQEALPHLQRLAKQRPDSPQVAARMGQYRFLQGDLKEARRLLEAAREKMPDDGPVLLHLARIDLLEGRAKQAEAHLRHMTRVAPGDTDGWFSLAAALQAQRRTGEAAKVLEHHRKLKAALDQANKLLIDDARHPTNDPAPAAKIGAVLLELGHDRLGLHWLNEALRRDPSYADAHRALAEHHEKKGNEALAARHRARLRALGQAAGR